MAKEVPLPDIKPVLGSMRDKFPKSRDQLIPMLQYVQTEMGYLPSEAMKGIAEYLKVPASHVYGVATFYAQFRFKPLGKNRITVCRGTACHVRGSSRLLEDLERELGIKPGDTTEDREFSLETVACIGSCALAPVEVVNNKVYAKMTSKKQKGMLDELKGAATEAPQKEPAEEKPAAGKKAAEKPEKKKPAPKKKPAKKAAKRTRKRTSKKKTSKKPAKKKAKKKAVKKAAKKKTSKKRAAKKKPAAKKAKKRPSKKARKSRR